MKKLLFILFFLISLSTFSQNTKVNNLKWFNVKDYGAVGDSTTDDYAAIQKAHNARMLAGGGYVYYPTGKYSVTQAIIDSVSNMIVVGEGESSVVIGRTDFGDIYKIFPTVSPTVAGAFTGIQFRDIYIKSAVTRTSGYAINTKWTHNATFQNVRIGTMNFTNATNGINIWSGINMDTSSNWVMINCQINAHMYGVHVTGSFRFGIGTSGVGSNYYDGLITGNCNIWGDRNNTAYVNGSAGVWIDGGTGGVQISQSAISEFAYGIRCRGTNRELFLDNAFYADDCGGAGLWISDTLNILNISNAWFGGVGNGSQTPAYGIYLDSNVKTMAGYPIHTQVSIAGGTLYSNLHGGMYFGEGDIVLSGVRSSDNGTAPDINIGLNVTSITVSGCKYTTVANTSSPLVLPKINTGNIYGLTVNDLQTNNSVISATNSSTGGVSNVNMTNSGGKALNALIYGSAVAGTTAGVTNANLASVTANGDNMIVGTSVSAPLYLMTNSVRRLYMDASGNFGLNMSPVNLVDIVNNGTNPSVLSVANNNAGQYANVVMSNSGGKILSLAQFASGFGGTTGGVTNANLTALLGTGDNMMMGTTSTQPLYFITNNTQRLSFTSAGDMTIGIGKFGVTEGVNGRVGQVALVAGTKAITITGLTTSSRAIVSLVTPNTASLTVMYQAVCTSNTLTITALIGAGTINNVDVSTVNYFVIN